MHAMANPIPSRVIEVSMVFRSIYPLTNTLGDDSQFSSSAKLFSNSGRSSATTPADMASLFVQLGSRSILTPELCDKALDILSRQQLMDIMARELPYDPFNAEEGSPVKVKLACKSGALRGVHHDVGLVTTEKGTYALALMSKDCADQRFHPDNEAVLLLAHISRWVFEYYTR